MAKKVKKKNNSQGEKTNEGLNKYKNNPQRPPHPTEPKRPPNQDYMYIPQEYQDMLPQFFDSSDYVLDEEIYDPVKKYFIENFKDNFDKHIFYDSKTGEPITDPERKKRAYNLYYDSIRKLRSEKGLMDDDNFNQRLKEADFSEIVKPTTSFNKELNNRIAQKAVEARNSGDMCKYYTIMSLLDNSVNNIEKQKIISDLLKSGKEIKKSTYESVESDKVNPFTGRRYIGNVNNFIKNNPDLIPDWVSDALSKGMSIDKIYAYNDPSIPPDFILKGNYKENRPTVKVKRKGLNKNFLTKETPNLKIRKPVEEQILDIKYTQGGDKVKVSTNFGDQVMGRQDYVDFYKKFKDKIQSFRTAKKVRRK